MSSLYPHFLPPSSPPLVSRNSPPDCDDDLSCLAIASLLLEVVKKMSVCQSYVTHLCPVTIKRTSGKPSFLSSVLIFHVTGFCSFSCNQLRRQEVDLVKLWEHYSLSWGKKKSFVDIKQWFWIPETKRHYLLQRRLTYFPLSLSLSLSVCTKGLIVFIAEPAASVMGDLKECIQELHNITFWLCIAVHIYFEGHANQLNRTSGKLPWLWPACLIGRTKGNVLNQSEVCD